MRRAGSRVEPVMRVLCGALALVVLGAAAAFAGEPQFPPLTGRVVDDAGIISDATQRQLDSMLAAHERATGEQLVVVTLKSLQGYSIEDFGYRLGRHWGIGQEGKNNGVLLIVAPHEHKVRIEIGYGLEGKLTDAASSVIIDRDLLPGFRRGDFNAGVLAGAGSILRVLSGDAVSGADGGLHWDEGRASIEGMPLEGQVLMLGSGLLFLILVFGARFFSRKIDYLQYGTRRSSRHDSFLALPPRHFFSGGGGHGSGGGGGGSGGGFSGGGGSFGGGGASGSW